MTDPQTYLEWIASAAKRLSRAGVNDARRDARRLMQHAAGLDAAGLISAETYPPPPDVGVDFNRLIDRRACGEPVSKILGKREFYGRVFEIGPAVLDPRADTEIVVEQALQFVRSEDAHILELGVGSGCILATLLAERSGWTGLGVDISAEALKMAAVNCHAHSVAERVELHLSNWFDAIDEKARFDLIVSNPPYILSDDIAQLQREVRDHDPHLALDGGVDGLDAYRLIATRAAGRLKPDGVIVFEVGAGQADDVCGILETLGDFTGIGNCKDLSGIKRCVYGRKA